jgi:ankyrin repeat protein
MAASSWSSKQLIDLCRDGNREQLLAALEQPSAIRVALDHESVVVDRYTGGHRVNELNLERMITWAASAGDVAIVDALLKFSQKHGVPVDEILTSDTIYSAFKKNTFQLIRCFEALDANVFTRHLSHGQTILELACGCGLGSMEDESYVPLVQYMMEKGVNPNEERIERLRGPGHLLFTACMSRPLQLIECLLDHGIVVVGSCATRSAAARGRRDVLETLLRYGADVNEASSTSDINGSTGTALHVAAERGRHGTVKWLLAHGADPNIRNIDGKTPRDLVSEKPHNKTLNYL